MLRHNNALPGKLLQLYFIKNIKYKKVCHEDVHRGQLHDGMKGAIKKSL